MDESSNVETLKQRILQLEQECEELRLDVEQLCMQQSGMHSGVDVPSQIQARRVSGLEQEVELLKHKGELCTRNNHKLLDELSEAKRIKAQFADALRVETEKNINLNEEIKFFQSKVASTLVERDRALVQVERERELISHGKQLQDRLDLSTSKLLEQREYCQELEDKARREADELERLLTRLKESEVAMVVLQEESHSSKQLVVSLEGKLDEVTILKQRAEERGVLLKEKLLHLAVITTAHLDTLRSTIMDFKGEVIGTLREEENWVGTVSASCLSLTDRGSSSLAQSPTAILTLHNSEDDSTCISQQAEASNDNTSIKESHSSCNISMEQDDGLQMGDTKEALALALHQKVATLLLLSQQEERHILEDNVIAAQERKIAELQKQLLQVTVDKGKALTRVASLSEELANTEEQLRRLGQVHKDTGKTSSRNQNTLPNRGHELSAGDGQRSNQTPALWRFGHRFKGPESFSSFGANNYSGTKHRGDLSSMARLQAENAAVWGMLSTLEQLCSSVNRLLQMITKVTETPPKDGRNALQTVDNVIAEARHLARALGSGPFPARHSCSKLSNGGPVFAELRTTGKDVVSTFGLSLLDSLLFAAEISRTRLALADC